MLNFAAQQNNIAMQQTKINITIPADFGLDAEAINKTMEDAIDYMLEITAATNCDQLGMSMEHFAGIIYNLKYIKEKVSLKDEK